MTGTQSLSERLREVADWFDNAPPPPALPSSPPPGSWVGLLREAADALDQKDAEIELLKEGRKLHDELADHLEHAACAGVKGANEALAALNAKDALLAQAAAALKLVIDSTDEYVRINNLFDEHGKPVNNHDIQLAREALAAIRKEQP